MREDLRILSYIVKQNEAYYVITEQVRFDLKVIIKVINNSVCLFQSVCVAGRAGAYV